MQNKTKKRLASLLAAVMLITAAPVTALAEEDGVTLEAVEQAAVPADGEAEPAETADPEDPADPAEPAEDAAEVPEDPAEPSVEPEDGGSVEDAEDDYALSEIGFWIDGNYVQAEEEEDGIAVMSLLPLEEKRFSLDLTGYFPEELKNTQISWVLENLTGTSSSEENVTASDVAVWAKWGYVDEDRVSVSQNDRYTLVGNDSTIDLSNFYSYYSDDSSEGTYILELIIGKPDQLDSANRRYVIRAATTAARLDVTAKDGIVLTDWYTGRATAEKKRYDTFIMQVDPDSWDGTSAFPITMAIHEDYAKRGAVTVEFYEGYHETAAQAQSSTNITSQIYGASAAGYSKNFAQKELLQSPAVTAVFQRNGKAAAVYPFYLRAYLAADVVSLDYTVRTKDSYYFRTVGYDNNDEVVNENGVQMTVYELNSTSYSENSEYYVSASFEHYGEMISFSSISDYVAHTALGYYADAAAAKAQTDITQQLFDDGYPANYSGKGQVFTVVLKKDNSVKHLGAIVKNRVESDEPSSQTAFHVSGAYQSPDSRTYESYTVGTDLDSFAGHYQTVFLMDRQSYEEPMLPVTDDTIYPIFYSHSKARVVAAADGKDLGKQTSGQSPIPFQSGKTIEYTVYSEDSTAHDNYFVTFLTQQQGPKLYVNAQNCIDPDSQEPYRTISMEDPDEYHDILFANIGDEELTGLYVRLEGAETLQLDPYWTINGNSTGKLAPFTTVESRTPDGDYAAYGELSHIGKIRLLPKLDENGDVLTGLVDGYLVIGSANGGEVKMKLTGATGRLQITNTDLIDGVQYVPYSSGIRTNCINANHQLQYTILDGTLPSPLTLNQNTGEIYGVPKVYGEFPITVQVQYKNAGLSGESLERMTASAEFTLTILPNTDDNVWNATDEDYTVTETVGSLTSGNHYVWFDGNDVFTSQGTFGYFVDLYLDGDKLQKDVDYLAESGSTVITVLAQTLSSKGEGTHTLAAEFRDSNGELRKAAQNFEVKIASSSSNSNQSSSSSKKPSSSRPTNYPAPVSPPSTTPSTAPSTPSTPSTTPSTPSTTPSAPSTGLPFTDVLPNSWFLNDVTWVYQQEVMNGTSDTSFEPGTPVSQAVIVTVLARMAKADLSQFAEMSDEVIASGQWYSAAALWAKQAGLLPDASQFNGTDPISRDQMAIMLVKYLRSMGKDTTPPAQTVAFADADQMSPDGNNAFQVLYQYNIFKGVGNGCMDPHGTTTRAQFAALAHRLADTAA